MSKFATVAFGCIWLLAGSEAEAQQFVCGNSTAPLFADSSGSTAEKPTPSASCGRQSSIYSSFFKKKETYVPFGTIKPETVKKKIKLRFMFANPLTTQKNNFKDNAVDRAVMQKIVDDLNTMNASPAAPTYSQTSVCGTCAVPDNRIRYELARVTEFNSRSFYFPGDFRINFINDFKS